MQTTKITSAGIIRNAEKPRTGVVSANRLAGWVFDEIDQGIDLNWELFEEETRASLRDDILADNPDISDEDLEDQVDELWENDARDHYNGMERHILFGDWKKDPEGLYVVDTEGPEGYSASFSSETNIVCVEWSKDTTPCHHTSPCYVMSDGSGPCGSLDTPGDSVVAYTLPPEFFNTEED